MAIPKLNSRGLLPVGVHLCTLAEVRKRFGSFQESDRRIELFEKLTLYMREVRAVGIARAVVIDGSFVTANPLPGDIDLIVALGRDVDFAREEVLPVDYNALSKRRVRRRFKFDVFVDVDNSTAYKEHLRFFQQVRGQKFRKGVLRVEL